MGDMRVSDGIEGTTDELLEELARRLDVANGRVKLELIFVDGKLEDGYRHHRLDKAELASCLCRRHAWNPSCPRHPATATAPAR